MLAREPAADRGQQIALIDRLGQVIGDPQGLAPRDLVVLAR